MRRSKSFFRWLTACLLLSLLGVGILGGAGLSARAAPVAQAPLSIVINEVAWMGTQVDANDEWIELYNPSINDVDLTGWQLLFKSSPTTIATTINLSPNLLPGNILPAGGYFLLERTDDAPTSITADLTYTGGLTNTGMILELVAPGNVLIDTANKNGGGWPDGINTSATQRFSMERISIIPDTDSNWGSNDGVTRNGLDAASPTGNPINGTPKQQNSIFSLAPPAPAIEILINEVAWAGTMASSDDEWIELYNPSLTDTIDISGWRVVAESGTLDIVLPAGTTIGPDGYFLLERARPEVTNAAHNFIYLGALSDSGEILRLRKPDGTIVDTANSDGGAWPAGSLATANSMERMGILTDAPLAWVTNVDSASWTNTDAASNLVHGTPGRRNWGFGVTHTPVPTNTPIPPSPTNTSTPSPTLTPAPTGARTIVINEIAWAGTLSSSDDEWIELYNPSSQDVNLTNWNLRSSDGSPDIKAEFKDIILKSGAYLLLERTDDDPTNVPANVIYTGSFNNNGEVLSLYDPNGYVVDSANSNGGMWPAGIASTFSSMQRSIIAADSDFVWVTYDLTKDSGTKAKDASGNEIKGTPGRANTPINVTPTATPRNTAVPGSSTQSTGGVVLQPVIGISEFLPRPGYDWNNDGIVDVFDEFIEIINAGRIDINLSAYQVDDEEGLGSVPYTLPDITLKPDERAVFYASETGILLSDAGDTVRLLRSSTVIDAYTYTVVRYPDQSWCRIPDRLGYWNDPCFPTPNNPNALTGTIPLPSGPLTGYQPQVCLLPDTTPEEFIYAECEVGGDGIWNRQYWDGADASERLILDEEQKWETVFE